MIAQSIQHFYILGKCLAKLWHFFIVETLMGIKKYILICNLIRHNPPRFPVTSAGLATCSCPGASFTQEQSRCKLFSLVLSATKSRA